MSKSRKKPYGKILGHLFAFGFSIGLTVVSGQSPRVLLYAHAFSVLYRLVTVWVVVRSLEASDTKGWFAERCIREPLSWERSKPLRDERTRKPAGTLI